MHPSYLAHYITQLKHDITTDVDYIHKGLKGIQEAETALGNKFVAIELDWLMVNIIREAHLFRHHLHQLEKGIEKIANQPIQNDVRGEYLPTEVCTRT